MKDNFKMKGVDGGIGQKAASWGTAENGNDKGFDGLRDGVFDG